MRRFSAAESSPTVYSGRFGRAVSDAETVGVMRGISTMRPYDTRAGLLPRQCPGTLSRLRERRSVKNPLPLAGEGRVRVWEHRRTRKGRVIAPSPHPDPLPQAGEGDSLHRRHDVIRAG